MKKRILYITMLLGFIFISSCDDYVDITPKGIIIPEQLEDLRLFLNQNDFRNSQVYTMFMDDDLALSATHVAKMKSNLFIQEGNAYTFDDYITPEAINDTRFDYTWQGIGLANYVLGELENVEADNQDLYNEVKGEALVHRAQGYFMLVNQYAHQYSPESANEPESGIPIVTTFGSTDQNLTRATVQEVYDLILDDLHEAETLLSVGDKDVNYKPTKAAALGCLAKVYLQMGQLENARDFADQALGIKSDLLDYRVDDNIGSLAFDFATFTQKFKPGLPRAIDHPEVIYHKFSTLPALIDFSTFTITYLTFMSDNLVALFDQENDLRYVKLINPATNRYMGFDRYYSAILGLTIPELYLIRAECNARLGSVSPALDDITTLLTYRYKEGTVPDYSNISNQEEALEIVLNERRKEMMFLGRRYFDIKRFKAFYGANISLSHIDENNNTVTLSSDDPKWTLAFPPYVVSKNPEIRQNPRN